MNTDKILPIDLYHAVSTANLTLESNFKESFNVEVGQDHECCLWKPGTLAVICRGGKVRMQSTWKGNLHSCRTGVPGVCGRCE